MTDELAHQVDAVQKGIQPELMQATFGPPSFFTCPECHGSLWEISEDNHLIFRCHVGHAYTMENLLIDQNDALERALWAALRSLEENGALNRRLAERSIERGLASIAARFQERAEETEKHAKEIRTALRRTQALDQAELNEVA